MDRRAPLARESGPGNRGAVWGVEVLEVVGSLAVLEVQEQADLLEIPEWVQQVDVAKPIAQI